jgi:ribosomal protein S18 acetylase RimI-like enzyme
MNLTIKKLIPDLAPAYLDFFDNRAFENDGSDPNGPCYCTCPTQTSEEIDLMVSEFGDDIKVTLRRYAAKMVNESKIQGYLAFDGDISIGWCNAGEMSGYVLNRYQFVPDFARQNAARKTISVVCFSIAPDYRGKGVSTALLERVVADAEAAGYAAVDGYAHIQSDAYNDFKGPVKLYEKLGFEPAAEQNGIVVMRKVLKGSGE